MFLGYSGSDASLEVARELTAARLNLRMGTPPRVIPTADAADAYLVANPPGSDPRGDARQEGRELRDGLRRYNRAPCKLGLPIGLPGPPAGGGG